jgi:hypothetical protein
VLRGIVRDNAWLAVAGTAALVISGVVAWGPAGAARPRPAPALPLESPVPSASPGPPAEIFLAFADPAPSDAGDPCRTGSTYRQNAVGDHDDVVVCTFDASGVPSPTNVSSTHLRWSISTAYGGGSTAVRFNPSPPPAETSGSAATATAGIDAIEETEDNVVNVSLLDDRDAVVDSFSIEKDVRFGPEELPPWTRLTAHKDRKFIGGKAVSVEPRCEPRRQVDLYRRRKGQDDWIGSDTTNRAGQWRVVTGRRRGTYYARAPAKLIDNWSGGHETCMADQSNDVRRG